MKKLYVIGIGPGKSDYMTQAAHSALSRCELICGYTVYIDLIKNGYPNKQFYSTAMTQETERCEYALSKANEGITAAIVCSGDAAVYGMAGLVYQLAQKYAEVEIEIVAGITAALSGGAVLGAPLTNDFAVVSLSDLLTDWQLIERRIAAAAMADFVICLYNPSSKKRSDYLQKACDIVLQYRSEKTICGYVKNIGRDGEQSGIITLSQLRCFSADMFTTIFIGSTATQIINGKMVTARGYENKP